MRIVGHEEDLNQEWDLVSMIPYGEEGSCSQSKEGFDCMRNAYVNYHDE